MKAENGGQIPHLVRLRAEIMAGCGNCPRRPPISHHGSPLAGLESVWAKLIGDHVLAISFRGGDSEGVAVIGYGLPVAPVRDD